MIQKLFISIFLFFCSSSSIAFTKNNFSNNQLLCPTLLWGFEFISSNDMKSINSESKDNNFSVKDFDLKKIITSDHEVSDHENMLSDMHERTSVEPLWRKNQ